MYKSAQRNVFTQAVHGLADYMEGHVGSVRGAPGTPARCAAFCAWTLERARMCCLEKLLQDP